MNFVQPFENPLQKEVALESDMTSKHTDWWKQLRALTHRSFMNMSRDIGYYWLRIVFYVIVSVCAGTIFYNVGNTYWAIMARRNCDTFVYGFMIFLSIGGLPFFAEEMKVHEILNLYLSLLQLLYRTSSSLAGVPASCTTRAGSHEAFLLQYCV